ncbi:LLM class flavin-dependent oxidoreductase [Cryptosporangium aurantiacum]|uniref:Luciferase-like monooxygenase n=1 Tax=Cryptosporangium aurantiacum TaxID=134849 RepID=A0A1M7RG29_9ACTN|nr:Luciferase-like monooxygenase [Cryptosporangium aurantiacum]
MTPDDQWERLRENYGAFRALWRDTDVSWTGRFRDPLDRVTALPRPGRPDLRIWHGANTSRALVGVGSGGFFAAATSQDAKARFAAAFERRLAYNRRYEHGVLDRLGITTVEDYVTKTAALVGSPQQIVDALCTQYEYFAHDVVHLHVDAEALSPADYRTALELFASEIALVVLRELPNKPIPDWRAPATAAA